MTITATTAKELGQAIKEERDEIILEGDIKKHTFRIRAVGRVAWAVAIGAIAVAVVAIIATIGTGGADAPVTVPAEIVAYSLAAHALGGISTVTAAIGIAVAAGGVGALTTLRRKYSLKQSGGVAMLVRK